MITWVKENTNPEEIGVYDPITQSLTVSCDLKLYPGYSFTKPVSQVVPAENNTFSVFFVNGVAVSGTWGGPGKFWKHMGEPLPEA